MPEKKQLTVAVFCAFGTTQLAATESGLLKAFCKSVKQAYRNNLARLCLLTDEFLQISPYDGIFDDVIRVPVTRNQLLLSRAEAYLSIIKRFSWDTPLALLDYDILMLKKIDQIFLSQHDVYVTCRNYSENMPVNGGVVMLNNIHPDRCHKFYRQVVETYRSLPAETLQWWGDQLALSHAVFAGRSVDINVVNEVITSGDVRVRLLDRARFNFTPYDVDTGVAIPRSLDQITKMSLLNDVSIAHFKGPRKHLMIEWAKAIEETGYSRPSN